MSIISSTNLTKTFGKTRALDGAELHVEAGQIHGFLGPNGAGKSTTIRALLGQISLDDGDLRVFGKHPQRDAVAIHENLTYVPGDVVLWPGLTGGECLDMLGSFHGREDRARRDHLVDEFRLDIAKKSRTYSKGNRQKVALISALAMDVDLYVFDEPTSGLDPIMEVAFQRAVRERVDAGATVLLSSHILDEVEALCSHVTILRAGRTVSTGSLEELRQSTVTTITATLPAGAASAIADRLGGIDGINDVSIETDDAGEHLAVKAQRSAVASAVGLVASAQPLSLVVRPPSLDELFLEHYEGQAEASR